MSHPTQSGHEITGRIKWSIPAKEIEAEHKYQSYDGYTVSFEMNPNFDTYQITDEHIIVKKYLPKYITDVACTSKTVIGRLFYHKIN